MGKSLSLGIDIGSVSVKLVIIDESKKIIEKRYIRSKGQPLFVLKEAIEDVLTRIPEEDFRSVSVTGSGARLASDLLGCTFENEVIALVKAVGHLYPHVRSIIEMGGEDSKLILLKDEHGRFSIKDFSMNSVCAAGTGSFLDQQASRLGFTIEEFGELALKSNNPPRIAGRCSVFAKSDMIHLQQIATPDYDIVAGLCLAVARNFISTIGRGKTLEEPIAFCGGVAANNGMRRAFEEVLELKEGRLIIPEAFSVMGAIGASLIALEGGESSGFSGFDRLISYRGEIAGSKSGLEALGSTSCCHAGGTETVYREDEGKAKKAVALNIRGGERIESFLGIDIGSISTNLVIIDKNKNVLAKRYIMTAGRPIEAVKGGLKDIGDEMGAGVEIKGVATTGSGRYLIGDLVGADIIRNEITAQATAAINIDKEVDTIFEIGGQDSKYISIDNGVVVDFEMNKACAAGTGSFLEEQAERLGVRIKGEFGDMALSASSPCSLGEKCTVFMESDLVHHQQRGAKTDELVGGLSYSIVHNYINRVVGDRRIGNHILFQGGVAANKGVVAAFSKVTGKNIIVPEHHEVTGAIGAAILALESGIERTNFKGFDIAPKGYEISTFDCMDCSNRCEVRKVHQEGEEPLFYGGRCEKYEIKGRKKESNIPDLYAEREKLLLKYSKGKKGLPQDAPTIGIPKALFFYELLPLFKTFFSELGLKVVVSETTNKEIIHDGIERVVGETCFPVKVAHGHVVRLLERGVDFLFIPSFLNMKSGISANGDAKAGQTCPYVQAFPYMIRSAIDIKDYKTKIISPPIHLGYGKSVLLKELKALPGMLGMGKVDIKGALEAALHAQEGFYSEIKKKGRDFMDSLSADQVAMVIISRSYNGCDPAINLGIPKKLRDLGIPSIPIDFLPQEEGLKEEDSSYWVSGKRILRAGMMTRKNENLYPLYITNYGCGPDSFISHLFRDKMKGKPYLQIEVDEHSGDAGVVTRCEAFLDSLKGAKQKNVKGSQKNKASQASSNGHLRRVYIPYMADHAFAIAAAYEAHGIPAKVLPLPDTDSLTMGKKYTSGRECYPAILTAGDICKMISDSEFDPAHSAFMMPSGCGPCRFGHYHSLHRIILNDMGYEQVQIIAPNQDQGMYSEVGKIGSSFVSLCWQGIVAIDLMEKRVREIRPYEKRPGETDSIYQEGLESIYRTIKTGGDVFKALCLVSDRLNQVETGGPDRPLIGVVGEIYIRSNRFGNEDIIRKIERLGGEVWMPPIGEWFFYLNFTGKRRSLSSGDYSNYVRTYITDKVQRYKEHRYEKAFSGTMRQKGEPVLRSIIDKASPYIHESFDGEAILSVGKSIDFMEKGASGIINVMPLTCMPGTIVNAVLKRVREDHVETPFLNISYEGQEQTNNETRLEAFMHQVYQFKNRNGTGALRAKGCRGSKGQMKSTQAAK